MDKNYSMDSMEHFVNYDNYLIVLKYLEQDMSMGGGAKELTQNRAALLSEKSGRNGPSGFSNRWTALGTPEAYQIR